MMNKFRGSQDSVIIKVDSNLVPSWFSYASSPLPVIVIKRLVDLCKLNKLELVLMVIT